MQSATCDGAIRADVIQTRRFGTRWRHLAYSVVIGLLFLLPHLVRITALRSIHRYTPFSLTTPSNVVSDESFLYAAQANTTLEQHRRADDTDSWEHRDSFFPYSILPSYTEVGVAGVLAPGHPREGLARAQILFHFLFPSIMAWMLMQLLNVAAIPEAVAASLALLVMLVSFSIRTLINGVLHWLGGHWQGTLVNTLQAARTPNPSVSFVLLLGAMLLAVRALRSRSMLTFACAGFVGSLLFYAYTFYAISWSAACVFLAVSSLWPATQISRRFLCTLLCSIAGALPFLLWTHASKASGVYYERVARLGMIYSRSVSHEAIQITLLWGAATLALLGCWLWMRSRTAVSERRDEMHYAMLLTAAVALGGLAGLNMQIVTGFQVQAEFHFTHMVIQPAVVLLLCLLAAWRLQMTKLPSWIGGTSFALLAILCTASQVAAGLQSASFHRLQASDEALFDWLESHSARGSVVATTNLRVCEEMPVFTHNRLLVVNGTRAAGSDSELLERHLLANRLAGNSADIVADELTGENPAPDGIRFETYGMYLFEHSPFLDPRTDRLRDSVLAGVLHRYQEMDVAQALGRYRVDYLYTHNSETPAAVVGWKVIPVLRTEEGTLWSLDHTGSPDSAASR